MRQLRWRGACVLLVTLSYGIASPAWAQRQFVPNSRAFWDNSKNWTSNYGPAYRDTTEATKESHTQFLACSTQFALCFHSGAPPLPCTLSGDGRSANCQCPVLNETNYTLITAILNYPIYLSTVQACGSDGAGCATTDSAPVCNSLNDGALIPGADVISTFDTESESELVSGGSPVTNCPKAPYAACMTAPCKLNKDGSTATCKCPVFYGKFQLINDTQCSLSGGLIPSASYNPHLDPDPDD